MGTASAMAVTARKSYRDKIVLVGLMGAGKTAVGRRLAAQLELPFIDADAEIEQAAGMAVRDIFDAYGEAAFRDLERRVVARLLAEDGPRVIALGGGAFVDPQTRDDVRAHAVSLWLRADSDTLLRRCLRRKGSRPLLETGDPLTTLENLMRAREPAYSQADLVVDSTSEPIEDVVARALSAVTGFRQVAAS
ncbi:MAG: shikimate kinase [Geminicoccaceae bacterium]